jgi:hypothetical protein
MFKFGGLLVLIPQTRGLFLVMLRQCLSDFTIQRMWKLAADGDTYTAADRRLKTE